MWFGWHLLNRKADQGREGDPRETESTLSRITTTSSGSEIACASSEGPWIEYNLLSWKIILWLQVTVQEWLMGFSLTSTLTLWIYSIFLLTVPSMLLKMRSTKWRMTPHPTPVAASASCWPCSNLADGGDTLIVTEFSPWLPWKVWKGTLGEPCSKTFERQSLRER